jgi:hypothetical protein
MLSLQTLTTIEALLVSKSDPRWGEFAVLAQTIHDVQQARAALMQSRVQPAPLRAVPGSPEPATPPGHKEVG